MAGRIYREGGGEGEFYFKTAGTCFSINLREECAKTRRRYFMTHLPVDIIRAGSLSDITDAYHYCLSVVPRECPERRAERRQEAADLHQVRSLAARK